MKQRIGQAAILTVLLAAAVLVGWLSYRAFLLDDTAPADSPVSAIDAAWCYGFAAGMSLGFQAAVQYTPTETQFTEMVGRCVDEAYWTTDEAVLYIPDPAAGAGGGVPRER